MTQSDALQHATIRLDAAIDAFEEFLGRLFEDSESVAMLKEQVQYLTDERERLLLELEAERQRVGRLQAANDEVSGRLETVMGTLKDMMPVQDGHSGAGFEL